MTGADDEPTSVAEIALRRAVEHGSSPFLYAIDAARPEPIDALTYGEVASMSAALARALVEIGVAPGDRVGCYLPNTPSWVVASLAAWWSGCGVAAAGTLMPAAEVAGLFDMAGVTTVVTTVDAPELPTRFATIRVDHGGTIEDGVPGDVGAWTLDSFALPSPDSLAVAIFTSGTTGQPKGVTHTHRDIIASARRVAAAYARTSAYRPHPAPAHLAPGVLFNPFGHMAGYSRLAFRMWIGRPTAIVSKFTVPAAEVVLERFPVDSLQLTPTMIQMLSTAEADIDLSSVRYVTSGTAPLSSSTRGDAFEARFGVPVMQAYGMSELGAVAQERLDDVMAGRRGPGSVGRIAAGVEVDIRPIDDRHPAGEGEIWVRTNEASEEYIGGARLPVDADGWFQTGDVGRIDEEILFITGRTQEKMIVGGFNVYPAEVEEAARRSPLVRDAVVVGIPDERLGERPVAGIVWAAEPDEAALLDGLRASLAPYKVPRVVFSIDAVPLTARDKVDRTQAQILAQAAIGRSNG